MRSEFALFLSDRGGDQAEQGRELIAKEDQRDHARDRHDHQDEAVLDQALSGLGLVTGAALCDARHATGPGQRRAFVLAPDANCPDPQSSGQAAVGQLASKTRTTSRPWSTSSAAAPIVSARCWISRHVVGGRASALLARAARTTLAARVSSIISLSAAGISRSCPLPRLSDGNESSTADSSGSSTTSRRDEM